MKADRIEEELDGHRSDCSRSARYHLARMRFFRWWASAAAVVTLVSGSSVFAALLLKAPGWVALAASVVVMLAQLVELIFQVSAKAMTHRSLADAHIALEKRVADREGRADAEDLRRIRAELLEIETREPPVYRALDVLCHNEVARALGREHDVRIVPRWRRLTAHWLPHLDADWRRRPPAG